MKPTKLAIIHTSPATVEPLKALAQEMIPGCTVINFVDDSILPQLIENGGDVDAVSARLTQYARHAAEAGADVILEACSSVGEVVAQMRQAVEIPVVRIDEALAEEAVRQGRRIGVAATLSTTLQPTLRLIERKAADAGKEIELRSILVAEAFQRLAAGDTEGHNEILGAALLGLVHEVDVVVLAQASMARVLPQLPVDLHGKFLSSPRLGMARVAAVVGE
ncbi:MAG: aspartate/glutamate racemase family protein [Caldilineaceae bacterium]|nr:aspartate/glutamate racemase family protein [Caldilineaceae bacterium]